METANKQIPDYKGVRGVQKKGGVRKSFLRYENFSLWGRNTKII